MIDKIDAIRHCDKRANIPTNELRGFMEDDERAPKTMLYPRDLSFDPQLVWKGKDEQDRERPQFSRSTMSPIAECSLV